MRRTPGTGSIHQGNDGSWWAAIYVGPRRVRRRRHSREDAEQALAEMLDRYKNEVGYFYHLARTGQRTRPARPGDPWYHEPKRRDLSPAVRFRVLERDGFRCAYCGVTSQTATLVVDHVRPVAAGGSNDMDNLTTACETCNLGKGEATLRVLPGRLTG